MRSTSTTRVVMCSLLFAMFLLVAIGFARRRATAKEGSEPLQAPVAKPYKAPDGQELFVREWKPNDPRSHSGDGLGPMFNAKSCVACHNQGGTGGGGPASKNVHILTRSVVKKDGKRHRIETQSFVLHHFGTDSEYAKWRAKMAKSARMVTAPTGDSFILPSQPRGISGFGLGGFGLSPQISQRNTPALFGLGLIDAISERTLEEAAAKRYAEFPRISGRAARDKDGIGRFGWKGQKSSLEDFVLTACAVELGLQVRGHDQPPTPHIERPKVQQHQPKSHPPSSRAPGESSGLDMTTGECDALVDYVRSLPVPTHQKPSNPEHANSIDAGKQLFTTVGCNACHTPNLANVTGIYSDLLLHDLGPGLSDVGSSYGVLRPNSPSDKPKPPKTPEPKGDDIAKRATEKPAVVATAQEWRTPPLWGVRDSAPYLHDGRAKTLEHAIAFHAGEATDSTKKFNALPAQDKQKLITFLKSLVAPLPSGS